MNFSVKKIKSFLRNNRSIYDLSWKLHLVFALILLMQVVIITPYRYFYFPKIITYVNLIEIFIYASSITLCYLGKRILSIYISAYGIPLLFSFIIFKYGLSISSSLWFLLSFLIIYLILIRGLKARLLYTTVCLVIFFLPAIYTAYEFPENIIKVIQIFTLLSVPILISSFLELQDSKVISLNRELDKKYNEKNELSKELSEKNQDLQTFSYIMSHDLKAPLRTIVSFSQLINKSKEPLSETNRKYFSFIESSAELMEILIIELITYSKIDQSKVSFEKVDLNNIITEIKQFYTSDIERGKIQFICDYLPEISGDQVLLKTLFRNLVSNALKYQPKNKINHIPTVKISSTLHESNTRISIADNGIGVSEEYKEKLFEPFERFHNSSDYQGTGLGLAIAKKVLEKHEATIELQNSSLNGSQFVLSFKGIYK